MDLPRDGRALRPLITIRAMTRPKETLSLIQIRGFTKLADHRLPPELQHSDTTQADEEVIAKLRDENQALRESYHAKATELSRMKGDLGTRGALREIGQEVDNILHQLRTETSNIQQEVGVTLRRLKSETRGVQADVGSFNSSLEHHEEVLTSTYASIRRVSAELKAFKKNEQSQASGVTAQGQDSPVSSTQGESGQLEDMKSELAHSQDAAWRLKRENQALTRENQALDTKNTDLKKLMGIAHDTAELKDLRSQLAQSRDKAQKLEAKNQALSTKNRELEDLMGIAHDTAELKDLRSQLAQSRDKAQKLEVENQALNTKNVDLAKLMESGHDTTELEDLRSQLAYSQDTAQRLKGEKQALSTKNGDLEKLVAIGHNAIQQCKDLKQSLKEAKASSRVYFERFLSLRGAFRVCCRIRAPEDPSAQGPGEDVKVDISKRKRGTTLTVTRSVDTATSTPTSRQTRDEQKSWVVDQVFTSTENNDVVWEEVEPLLESAKDGAPVLIILYGRTGTGKSWTSQGIWDHITRLAFPKVQSSDGTEEPGPASSVGSGGGQAQDSDEDEDITLWSVEIYLDDLYDILSGSQKAKKLNVPKSGGVFDPGDHCRRVKVVDGEGLEDALAKAARTRRSAQTDANESSSRSHCFTGLELLGGGSITLVDLAGHEKSGVAADSAESKFINSSLTALIDALGQLKTALHGAGPGTKKGQTGQKAQNKGKNQSVTSSSAGMSTPTQTSKGRDISKIWSAGLLTRLIGAMVLRGCEGRPGEQPELRSKVMFMATLDFSSDNSTKGSENTMESLKVLAEAK